MFRIKHPDTKPGAPVVFLMHGVICSADYWVVNDEESPAFYLANKGYDVWLGNHRGTKYSRDHESLDPNEDADYWKFSHQEVAEQDLPAFIDSVREKTG
mgnify:CR=1 FL=1